MRKHMLLLFIILVISFVFVGCGDGDSDIPKREENDKYYTVNFSYNDGSGRVESIKIKEGQPIENYAPYAFDDKEEIVGWSTNPESGTASYLGNVTANATLYAVWEKYNSVSYDETGISNVLRDRFIEFRPSEDPSVLNGKTMKISSAVKHITLCSQNIEYSNFAIYILERTTNLYITLNNFSYTCSKDVALSAENLTGNYRVSLEVLGENQISCISFVSSSRERGADCIEVSNLDIRGSGALSLISGNGCNGQSYGQSSQGHDGAVGGQGQAGGCGIVATSVTIADATLRITTGNGGRGGHGGAGNSSWIYAAEGGNGGRGGNGGSAINTTSFKAQYAVLEIKTGNGGRGGDGGRCGGDAGFKIGAGGDGGRGGNGGNIFHVNTVNYVLDESFVEFIVGDGGYGGIGGESGVKNGSDGASGNSGIYNTP